MSYTNEIIRLEALTDINIAIQRQCERLREFLAYPQVQANAEDKKWYETRLAALTAIYEHPQKFDHLRAMLEVILPEEATNVKHE